MHSGTNLMFFWEILIIQIQKNIKGKKVTDWLTDLLIYQRIAQITEQITMKFGMGSDSL